MRTERSMEQLKEKPMWVCWKSMKDRKGRMTKVPFCPIPVLDRAERKNVLRKASSTRGGDWTDYQTALEAARNFDIQVKSGEQENLIDMSDRRPDGVGIVAAGGIVLIDLDDHRGEGLSGPARDILKMFSGHTYIERSPSGKGFHIICAADAAKLPPHANKRSDIEVEVYTSGRILTFTGEAMTDASGKTVDYAADCTDICIEFLKRYMTAPQNGEDPDCAPLNALPDEQDSSLMTWIRARLAGIMAHDGKFRRLYDGETAGYKSESEARLALCEKFAFYFDANQEIPAPIENVIDAGYRSSKLFREDKYSREITKMIQKALSYARASRKERQTAETTEEGEPSKTSSGPGRPRKPDLTIGILQRFLDDGGIILRRNIITHLPEYSGPGASAYNPETITNELPIILRDQLRAVYSGCTAQNISDYLYVIAARHPYNPVQEMLNRAEAWNGTDYIARLTDDILKVPDTDALSRVLIRKWLLQCLILATRNDSAHPFGADGVLVLNGEQGAGKSLLAQSLAVDNRLVKTGLHIDFRDKDTVIRGTGVWIAELGEIGSTMKSDVDTLKAFLTESVDRYRIPYGRTDDSFVRRTSFIATVNGVKGEKFLLDLTGNRRFWTVPLPGRMDPEEIIGFPYMQLWKQVEKSAQEMGSTHGFRLTRTEQDMLAERNGGFIKPVKGEDEVRDILTRIADSPAYEYRSATVTEFIGEHADLRRYDAAQIGKALTQAGYPPFPARIDGKSVRARRLPMQVKSQFRSGYQDAIPFES